MVASEYEGGLDLVDADVSRAVKAHGVEDSLACYDCVACVAFRHGFDFDFIASGAVLGNRSGRD
jgi:hypothetical protein